MEVGLYSFFLFGVLAVMEVGHLFFLLGGEAVMEVGLYSFFLVEKLSWR